MVTVDKEQFEINHAESDFNNGVETGAHRISFRTRSRNRGRHRMHEYPHYDINQSSTRHRRRKGTDYVGEEYSADNHTNEKKIVQSEEVVKKISGDEKKFPGAISALPCGKVSEAEPVEAFAEENPETHVLRVSFISKQTKKLISKEQLNKLFSRFGKLESVSIAKITIDNSLNIQDGYGFAHFPNSTEGKKNALLSSLILDGQTIDETKYFCSADDQLIHNLRSELLPEAKNPITMAIPYEPLEAYKNSEDSQNSQENLEPKEDQDLSPPQTSQDKSPDLRHSQDLSFEDSHEIENNQENNHGQTSHEHPSHHPPYHPPHRHHHPSWHGPPDWLHDHPHQYLSPRYHPHFDRFHELPPHLPIYGPPFRPQRFDRPHFMRPPHFAYPPLVWRPRSRSPINREKFENYSDVSVSCYEYDPY